MGLKLIEKFFIFEIITFTLMAFEKVRSYYIQNYAKVLRHFRCLDSYLNTIREPSDWSQIYFAA